MKKLLLPLIILISLSVRSQVIIQAGLGASTSGFVHPITEADFGWQFDKPFHGVPYQVTAGYAFNPYIDKAVYSVKLGAQVEDWTLKAGLGLVNQTHNIVVQQTFPPVEITYREDYYVSAYSILVLGVERYIKKWERSGHKVYYGLDIIDGNFHAKMGVRFNYKINK